MTSRSNNQEASGAYIVYDGECPYCRNYVRLIKLKESVGPVKLINARLGGSKVEAVKEMGYDLNEGMIFYYNNNYHYGADAINMMALMSTRSTIFNRLNKFIFKHPRLSKVLYPIMRCGRNITLKALGKKKIKT